jgi:hypothetical protein
VPANAGADPGTTPTKGLDMKKVLVILAVIGLGLLAYRKYAKDQAELDLWAEVTDPVA